jgi:hypothetical protein
MNAWLLVIPACLFYAQQQIAIWHTFVLWGACCATMHYAIVCHDCHAPGQPAPWL